MWYKTYRRFCSKASAVHYHLSASSVASDSCRGLSVYLHIHIPGIKSSASCRMDATCGIFLRDNGCVCRIHSSFPVGKDSCCTCRIRSNGTFSYISVSLCCQNCRSYSIKLDVSPPLLSSDSRSTEMPLSMALAPWDT